MERIPIASILRIDRNRASPRAFALQLKQAPTAGALVVLPSCPRSSPHCLFVSLPTRVHVRACVCVAGATAGHSPGKRAGAGTEAGPRLVEFEAASETDKLQWFHAVRELLGLPDEDVACVYAWPPAHALIVC